MKKEVIHRNEWYWGRSVTVILAGGYASVKVSVEDDDRSVALISDLIVHPERRGEGLGNLLLEKACLEAAAMGAKKVLLSVEPDSWMVGWYRRHGFTERGTAVRSCHESILLEKGLSDERKKLALDRDLVHDSSFYF